ncbi:hypothetical protein TNCV_5045721 [Trichonephila clavipes]|uniref:Uncharacterized protein n=1 Tax=Trichonephila clavipes TaxID=2585209 RepID=A0A8X6WHK2_TRICX|nr:hypothetical protein TNCV_5045721 [Trichonephila clavipes]
MKSSSCKAGFSSSEGQEHADKVSERACKPHSMFNVYDGKRKQGGKKRKPIGKIFAESLSRQQWEGGEGKTPPKAARIRHPKISPLNYAARGEESLRKGVTNKQKFQSTNSVPP